MSKTAVFELVQRFYHATEIDNVVNAVSACNDLMIILISLSGQNIDNCFGVNEISRNTILNVRSGRKVCKKW